jgi:membrane-associated phospholipid phosphatase
MKPATLRKDRGLLLNALFFLALLIFMAIAVCVYKYPENRFDRYVQEQAHPLASPALLPFWIRMTFFGSFEFLFPAWVIFILINVWQRKRRFGLSVAGVAIGGFLSVQLLKLIFQRYRPPTPLIPNFTDYSFPSGHSTSSFIFCAVLAYSLWHSMIPRSLRIIGMSLLILLTCSVGLSRIVLAVHYPTDVAAGFCLGMLWTIIWYRFVNSS